MHAYLIVGNGGRQFAEKLKAKIFEFPLKKIDDVRTLNSFTSLKVSRPTAIYINSIEEATGEALNAFLKNLEEPQENLYYILTTSSIKKVLPTIVSRCQVIKTNTKNEELENSKEIEKFLEMTIGEKLSYLDIIKDREKAIEFMEKFIAVCHQKIHLKENNYKETSNCIEQGISTLIALKANGNVSLQLANFALNLGN